MKVAFGIIVLTVLVLQPAHLLPRTNGLIDAVAAGSKQNEDNAGAKLGALQTLAQDTRGRADTLLKKLIPDRLNPASSANSQAASGGTSASGNLNTAATVGEKVKIDFRFRPGYTSIIGVPLSGVELDLDF